MGNRHSVIPQEHWTLMGKPVELLDADLTELENASPAAGPAVIPGANAWVRPNLQGGWDRLTRVPGVSYWWQRPITSTTNAPVPQYADGYEDGDLVSPLLGGEVLPYRGIVLSETGAATDAATVTGRATNNYAGGNDAYLWGGVKAIPTGEGRARFVPGNYLELYDGGYATITSPALPISTAFRCSWDVNLPASN